MDMLNARVSDFLNELSSDSPTPGGGSVAGLCGAIGSSLVSMVANLTIGREKYAESQVRMAGLVKDALATQKRYVDLAERDMEAFRSYMKALKMPKTTDEEKKERARVLQSAIENATTVPVETVELSEALARLALDALEYGNKNATSDAIAAAQIAGATARIASYNVRINLSGIKDADFRSDAVSRIESAMGRIEALLAQADRIFGATESS